MDKTGKTVLISLSAALAAAAWCVWGRSAASEAVYPVENGATWFSRRVVAPLRGALDGAAAAAEAVDLRRETKRLAMVDSENTRLRAENARLRRLLHGPSAVKAPGKWICAPVFSNGGASNAYKMLRVGRGSADGVKEGAPVAVPEGLVGRVDKAFPHASNVLLLTDETSKAACEFKTPGGTRVRAILSGRGARPGPDGGEMAVLYSPESMALGNFPDNPSSAPAPGAPVFTSGLGGVFPAGLLAGRVVRTGPSPSGACAEAFVAPAVDTAEIEDVFILVEGE